MTDAGEKKSDEVIDATLAILGNAAVPNGMELRLRQALQRQAESHTRQRWTLPFSPGLLTACFCGLVLLSAVMIRQAHTAQSHASAISSKVENRSPLAITPAKLSAPVRTPSQRSRHSVPLSLEIRPHVEPATRLEFSHPAPPLPLTEQEKLLLRIAHRGEPVEMAALDDAAARTIDFEAQKVQFNDFFYIHPMEVLNEDQ